jgi:hypothetical protein
MSATPHRSTAATGSRGVPPGPSETHQEAGIKPNESTRSGRFPVCNTLTIGEVR